MRKVLLTFGLFIATAVSTFAADKWYVRKENTVNPTPANKNYRTISEAISDTSRVANGDTVIVYEGNYPEQVKFINKRVVLGSQFLVDGDKSHIEKTIIDGDGIIQNNDNNDAILASYGYTNAPVDLQIIGLTVINAKRWAMAILGGTVKNCVIKTSGSNGYYLVRAANATFEGCTFQGNRGSALFGAMSFGDNRADNKSVVLKNSVFRDNILDNNTGDNCIVYSGYSQDVYVQNNLFYKNTGGNIFSLGGNGGNTGASISQNDSTFIVNCLIYENKSNVATIRSYERPDGGTFYFLNNIISKNEGSSPFAGSRYFSYRGTSNKFHIGFFNNYIPIDMSRENQQDLSTNATYSVKEHYGNTSKIIFRDTLNADYRLADSSFGLGMGLDTLQIVPIRDFNDSLRPLPVGSKLDLGPYENANAFSIPRLLRASPGRNKAYLSWSIGHPTYDSVQVFRSTDSLGTYGQIGNAGYTAPKKLSTGDLTNKSNYTYLGQYGFSKYYMSKTRFNWKSARQTAQDDGGDLVVFENKGEWDFVLREFRKNNSESFWLGLYQSDKTKEPKGNWVWVNNLPLDAGYSLSFGDNFGEPNNAGNNEDVALANDWNWNDVSETNNYYYVVEVDTRLDALQINYTDTALINGTRYFYRLRLKSGGINTGFSNILGARPNSGYPLPTNLIASNASRSVRLSWTNPATDKRGTGSYQIFRGSDSLNLKQIATVTDADSSYSDTSLLLGQTYYYRMKSIDADGTESDYTAARSVKINAYLFISANGNDEAFGTEETPLKTISQAMTKAQDGDTLILLRGNYLFLQTQRITKNVVLGSKYMITKDTADINETVIGSSSTIGSVFSASGSSIRRQFIGLAFKNNQTVFNLENVTVDQCRFINNGSSSNPNNTFLGLSGSSTVRNSRFIGNYGTINLNNNGNTFQYNYFEGNIFGSKANNQATRFFNGWYGKLVIENNIFKGNGQYVKQPWDEQETAVVGISGWGDTAYVANNTFIQNDAVAVMFQQSNKSAVVVNNLFYKNVSDFGFEKYNPNNNNNFVYSNISNNMLEKALSTYANANAYAYSSDSKNNLVNGILGFKDTVQYRIGAASAAIAGGQYAFVVSGTPIYNAALRDYYGNSRVSSKIDIGAEQTAFSFAAPSLNAEAGDKKVTLTWNRSSTKIRGYYIFRGTSVISDNVSTPTFTISVRDSLSLVDLDLTNNTTYYYRIQAYDSATTPLKSGLSDNVSVRPNVPPAVPSNFSGESGPRSSLLRWTKVAGIKYNIFRGVKADSLVVVQTNVDTSFFIDRSVDAGKDYFYAIKASDAGGAVSVLSASVSLRPNKTFYVDSASSTYSLGSSGSPLNSIQSAIDLSTDGDSILVKAGTYRPFRISNKSVVLKSLDGPYKTRIQSVSATDNYLIRIDGNQTDVRPYKKITVEGFRLSGLNGWRSGSSNGVFSITENTSPVLNNMIVADMNDQNIFSVEQSAPIFNNVIVHNIRNGNLFALGYSDTTQPENKVPKIFNATIYGFQGSFGGSGMDRSGIYVVNSIFRNCSFYSPSFNSSYIVRNSIVEFNDMNGKNGNMVINPEFINVDSANFRLSSNSAALGAGINRITVMGISFNAPAFDILGNSRPAPSATMPDLGAFENPFSFGAPTLDGEAGDKQVRLSWNRNSNRIKGYLVFRSTSPIPDTVTVSQYKIERSDSLSLVDNSLTNATRYYFRIRGYDTSATPVLGAISNEVSLIPNVPPAKPQEITGEAGARIILLNWKKADVVGIKYNLFKGVKSDSLVLYRRNLDTTTFIDTAVVPGINYHYAIKAVDPGGVASVFSDMVSLKASRTFYVDSLAASTQYGTPKYPYAQIQLAINRALAGDTVLVRPGTYEPFRIASKFLAVKSTAGPTKTHIKPTSIADFYLVRLENSGPYNYYDTTGNLSQSSLVEGFTLSNYKGNRNGFWQGAIGVIQNSLVTFNNLIVTNMEDNIVLSIENSGPTFNNCLFYNLRSNFISLGYADSTIPKNKMPKFINSTFYGIQNWGFTNSSETSLIPIVNSIIWGNIGNTSNQMSAKFFSVRNSIVQYPELAGKNNNIKADPQFLDESKGDFRLSDFSPALGKGQTSFTVNGYTFGAPAFDIEGNARPLPASTKPDLGVFENKYAFPAPTLTRLQRSGNQVKIYFKSDKSQPATKFTLHRSESRAALDTITAVLKDVNKDSTSVLDQLPDGKLYYYVMRMHQGSVQSGNSNVISTLDTLYIPEIEFGNDTATVRFRAGANSLSFINISGEDNTYPQVLAYDNSNKSANISNRSPNDSVFLIRALKSNKTGQSITLAVNRSMPVALGGAGDQMQILGPINLNFDDDFDFAAIYQKSGSSYTAANLNYDKGSFKFEQGTSLKLRFNQPGWLQLDSTVMPNFSFTATQFENDPGSRGNPNIRDAVDMIDGNFDGKQEHIISVSQLKWVPKFKAVNTGNYMDVNRSMRIVGYADLNNDGTKDVIGVTGNNWAVGYNNAQGISVHFFISNTEVGLYELRRSNLFIDWNSALFIRDFDNDGRVDLLARGVNNSNYAIYSINQDYSFKTSNKVLGINSDDSKITVGDINNDSFIDVLSLSTNGILNVYLNDQRTGFKTRTYNVPFEFNQNTNMWSAFQLKVMDMNSDGLNDVVWAENLYNGSVFSDQILKVMIQSPEGEVKMSSSVSDANAKVEVSNDGYNVKIKWSGFTDALGGKLTYNFRLDTVNTYVNRMLYTGFNYQRSNPKIPIVLDQVVSSLYQDSVIYKDVNISSKYPYFVGVQAVNAYGKASNYKEVTFRPKDPLEKQTSTLPGMTNARFAWGDYNNDGQLDLAVTGLGDENTGRILRIYKNESGKLVDLKLANRQLSGGDVKWVDIDKDGWLDLLASGQSGSVPYVALFKNNAGTFEISYPTSIPALKNSTMALGDHDNNGTVDLVIVGQDAVGEAQSYLLNNDGKGNFTQVPDFRTKNILPGLYNADLKFIDYDLDGDLDLIYTGVDNGGNRQGGIRLNTLLDARDAVNNNNQFFYSYGLNLKNARFDLGDADGDGDLDILVMGTDLAPNTQLERPITKLIKNLAIESRVVGNSNNYGNMFNSTSEAIIDSLNNGDVKFADINNDGLLDISITGLDVKNNPTTKIYISLGGFGNYSELKTLELPQFKNSAISWGDYNNDGNMDMVITGAKTVGAETVVYVNDQGTNKNVAPEIPSGLTITDLGLGRVVLKWTAPKDDHTTSRSLSYMIKLGTKPGLGDLSSIPVDSAGRLQSPTVPVIGVNEYYVELPPGQYYWSVMAIDGNFKNSKFSKEQSFILKYPWKYVNQGGIIDRRLSPVENGQFAWADMNNDGLTDFIYLGSSGVGGTSPAGIFRNIGGSFVKVENTNGNNSSGLNGIDNIKNVSVKFKDINNDGFVDLFVAGENQFGNQPIFKAFINRRNFNYNDVTGVFNINTLLRAPSIDFADLDNNGSPDMIYSGTDNRGVGQVIFTTTKVDSANQIPASPNGFTVSAFETNVRDILNREQAQNINLAFTDFNLDKRIDMVVLYDNVDGLRKAEVYNGGLNEFGKNVFTLNAGVDIPKVKFSTLDAVDFNKDGYPDLAISGYSSAGGQAFKIYRNAYDTAKKTLSFVDTKSDMLLPLQDGKTTWGDFNMDGYPDIIFSGNRAGSGYVTKMAATTVSSGSVSYAELPTFPFGDYIQLTPTMGDINGDGQLGVVLVGKENVNGSVTNAFKILQNVRGLSAKVPGQNGIVSGAAAPVQPMEKEMSAMMMAAQEEHEYENTMQEMGYSQQKIKLMMEIAMEAQTTDNEKFTENQSPSSPDSLRTSILGRSGNFNLVKLSWKPSKDDLTPSSGLTYAMRIGKKPGRSDIMDPESNKDGTRKTPTSGNTENNFSWDVQLPSGTYYWAVQAIDASFTGSPFSKESVLIIRGDSILNANAPSDILLNRQSTDTIYVSKDPNTTSSKFKLSTYSIDSALVTSYAYSLNEDDDPAVRNFFGIDTSNTLFLKTTLSKSEYDLRVITTDSRGISFEKPLKFIVVEAPSNILLDGINTSVVNVTGAIDSAKLNVVLTGVDAKFSSDKLTYSLIAGEGSVNNNMFSIKEGNKLFNKASIRLIDTLRLRVAVSNGFVSYEKQVRIISNCTFPSVKFTNSKVDPFKICEGDTVTLNLAATASSVNVFRDNNFEGAFANTNLIKVTKPGKYYAIYATDATSQCGSKTDSVFVQYNVPIAQVSVNGSQTICSNRTTILNAVGASGYNYQWLLDSKPISNATGLSFNASTAGEYTVKVTNAQNCSSVSPAVRISVIPAPDATLSIRSDTTICAGTALSVSVPSGAVSYVWTRSGVQQATGSNVFSFVGTGNLSVNVTGANGCVTSSNVRNITTAPNPPAPAISVMGTTSICPGSKVLILGQVMSGVAYQWLKDGQVITGASEANYNATGAGVYQLQVTNQNKCVTKSESVTMKLGASPAKPTVSRDQADMVSSAASGNQWFSQGEAVPGATDQRFRPSTNGYYTVRTTNAEGCVSSMSDIFYYLATAIVNLGNEQYIKLFPNPVVTALNMEYRISGVAQLNVRIYDATGRLVFEKSGVRTGSTLQLGGLVKGMYLIKVARKDGKEIYNGKMIKE